MRIAILLAILATLLVGRLYAQSMMGMVGGIGGTTTTSRMPVPLMSGFP